MARAGIYKSEVARARANLIAQGRHPSIDAVRIELGNTCRWNHKRAALACLCFFFGLHVYASTPAQWPNHQLAPGFSL